MFVTPHLMCLHHLWGVYGFEKNSKSYLVTYRTLFDLLFYFPRYRLLKILGGLGLRNAAVYTIWCNSALLSSSRYSREICKFWERICSSKIHISLNILSRKLPVSIDLSLCYERHLDLIYKYVIRS